MKAQTISLISLIISVLGAGTGILAGIYAKRSANSSEASAKTAQDAHDLIK